MGELADDESFLLRSQLSKLQLAVQSLSKENSRLKMENDLLMQHALPPPQYEQPRAGAEQLASLPPPLQPPRQSSDLPGFPSTIGSLEGPTPALFGIKDALEEIRILQHRLEVLRGRLREEEQPRLQHPQCYPPSPPGGGADFLHLVEELNGHRSRSPHPYQRSSHQYPRSPKVSPAARPCWRSPNARPRSPYPPSPGYNTRKLELRYSPHCGVTSPSAVSKRGGLRRPLKGLETGVSGTRKSRARSNQAATSTRLHYGIPCKQWQ